MRFVKQTDLEPNWPDTGRPNPYAIGPDRYLNGVWLVVLHTDQGDVWKTPSGFAILEDRWANQRVYATLEEAAGVLNRTNKETPT